MGEEDVFPQIWLNVDGQLTTATDGYVHLWNGCSFDAQALTGWDGQFGGSHDGIILERRAEGTRFWDGRFAHTVVFEYENGRVDTHLRRDDDIIFGLSRGGTRILAWASNGELKTLLQDGPPGDYVSIRLVDPLMFVLSADTGYQLYAVADGRAELVAQDNDKYTVLSESV